MRGADEGRLNLKEQVSKAVFLDNPQRLVFDNNMLNDSFFNPFLLEWVDWESFGGFFTSISSFNIALASLFYAYP